MSVFDPHSVSQEKLQHFRNAAEQAWADDTRHPDFQGHPCSAAGQCYVTSKWLQGKLGGHVGQKGGHYFWASPDKQYIIDLTGDQYAYEPTDKRAQIPQDGEDEPWEPPQDHQEHRPGPVVYTRADHPLYKGFRVKEDPENPRATLFGKRADLALEQKLPPRTADAAGGGAGLGGDAYPGDTPQKEEDYSQKYFHDALNDLLLTQEAPDEHEYRWFFGNGQLHVSPFHNHDELREHSGVAADDGGPSAAGVVNVAGGTAIWRAESNIAIRGLAKRLEEYGKSVGWGWGGLVRGNGESFGDDFGPKKSYWFGWKAGVQIGEHPFFHALGRFTTRGREVFLPRTSSRVREGLEEWARDFGYRIAEFPGGGNMMDKLKNKETLDIYDKGNPDKGEVPSQYEGTPQGELTCPHCGEHLPDYMQWVMHMDSHDDELDHGELDDGHFPTIEGLDEPLQLRPMNSEPSSSPLE